MSQCQVVCPANSSYNAVNIKINNPRANISDKNNCCDGDFNAVNLEINNPELKQKQVYDYPVYEGIITSDMTNFVPVAMPEMPVVPVAYKTSYINSKTYINTDSEKDARAVEVPAPNLTTVENEKKVSFNGLAFKAGNKPEIIADGNLQPAVNVEKVVENLSSPDYDVQAKQLEKIIYTALKDSKNAIPYVTSSVFTAMINIAEKDSSSLEGPSQEVIDARKKIITNEIIKEQQLANNKKPEEIELPYKLNEADMALAMKLSPMELVERNKEYALLTLAALTKIYAEDVEKNTGNVVSLTDLPGASVMVETLKTSNNPSVKMAAIESLVYINRPEYNKEIKAVLEIVRNDKNQAVSVVANDALKNI